MKFSELAAIFKKTHLPTLATASQVDYEYLIVVGDQDGPP